MKKHDYVLAITNHLSMLSCSPEHVSHLAGTVLNSFHAALPLHTGISQKWSRTVRNTNHGKPTHNRSFSSNLALLPTSEIDWQVSDQVCHPHVRKISKKDILTSKGRKYCLIFYMLSVFFCDVQFNSTLELITVLAWLITLYYGLKCCIKLLFKINHVADSYVAVGCLKPRQLHQHCCIMTISR